MMLFFKQKPAYEMRISDWSSDVCSSDLSSGRAPAKNTAIDTPAGAKAATPSPGRMEARVRPPRRVNTTDWDRVGTVSSRPSAADAAETEVTPGTRTEERSVGTEWFSTCSSRGSAYQ